MRFREHVSAVLVICVGFMVGGLIGEALALHVPELRETYTALPRSSTSHTEPLTFRLRGAVSAVNLESKSLVLEVHGHMLTFVFDAEHTPLSQHVFTTDTAGLATHRRMVTAAADELLVGAHVAIQYTTTEDGAPIVESIVLLDT